jgi:RNA polymerase sigma factor (sigma-70 family)
MAAGGVKGVVGSLRWFIDSRPATDVTDRQLLARFARDRDEAAFEALVRRHGPMVLGVCRRVLGSGPDVEDAFQTTFVVLVRRAHSIGRPELLGNWLYGVAFRTALKARATAVRRRDHERRAAAMAREESTPAESWRDVGVVLDEELNQLPGKYRAPLVLCYLQGRTHEEAARLLGWPTGSMSGRIAAGRKLLRKRLERRGVALAPGTLPLAFGPAAWTAPLPASLVSATVKAAVLSAAGKASASGALSASVTRLTDEVAHALWLGRLKKAVIVALTTALLAVGTAILARYPVSAPETPGRSPGTGSQTPSALPIPPGCPGD